MRPRYMRPGLSRYMRPIIQGCPVICVQHSHPLC